MKSALFILALLITGSAFSQKTYSIQANCNLGYTLTGTKGDSVLLWGLVTATDGIKSYNWVQTAGPSISLPSNVNTNQLFVKNLVPGTYAYNFSAISNNGTSLAPVSDTLVVYQFVDRIDSTRIYYRSGKVVTQK